MSTSAMPHLRHHCLVPQRSGWPDLGDRRPVVPAATVVAHLLAAAERAAAGARAVGVRHLLTDPWIDAVPQSRVTVVAAPEGRDRMGVAFGPFARASVELAGQYPPPPDPWDVPAQRPEYVLPAAAELYAGRWLTQGPAYAGVTALLGGGPRHLAAAVTVPWAPGGLLGAVSQLIGCLLLTAGSGRTVSVPVRVRGIRMFGPPPCAGTVAECRITVVTLTATSVVADAHLLVNGAVWAQVTGWQERRLAVPDTRLGGGYPERSALSRPQPGGWVLIRDAWPDPASRDLIVRTQLGGAEREEYARRSPHGRRQWLLGRIAAKDAVRHWLWARGAGPVYPAEIRVRQDADGRPRAVGLHGRELPALHLALAHRADAAVALVRAQGPGPETWQRPGIGVEEISERADRFRGAWEPGERELLSDGRAPEGLPVRAARFRAARQAVAAAEGTRLREVAVTATDGDHAAVTSGARTRDVLCAEVTSRTPGAPGRRYSVAWTPSPAEDGHARPSGP
ncbi:hypothetical protein V1J52_02495 [Streptomyces sp. TRM 70351]|uniref:hypothetical protein n=1 Tax=Streptomyces sp. TRM 70351 TaxID=3116552 RepID=UPI002E7AD27E|nr:hypothetical protein [Streptomyces sp. TRM 70351]MEE1927060.1 hypothetical protein [Streptomyces sp. TRM 70351]